MIIRKILLLAAVIAFPFCLWAQETTSEIVGTISDGKIPLIGATVTIVNVSNGIRSTVVTRREGRYNIPNLQVGGPYSITVSYVGFNKTKRDSVFLLLGQEFRADFALRQANTLKGVTVTSVRQNNVINSNRTGSQEIIGRTQIERLPTINRSLQDFTKLTPSSNGLSFGGRNSLYNNVTVDGANFNNVFGLSSTLGGQTNSQPISIDAIEQIQVSISPFDVRQGGFSGAGLNSVTRSGTNKIKGSVYTYIRTPGIQGYKVKTVELPQTDFSYNQRGLSVGGPIIENKLFFFVSAEQERVTAPATGLTALRSGQTAVPGSISQASYDSLIALRDTLKNRFGYNPGEFEGYNNRTQSDKITVKIDWNINDNNRLTLKYNYLKSFRDAGVSSSGVLSGSRSPGTNALPFSGSGYTINNNFNIFIAELNTKLGNKLNNKLQFGYSALRDFRASLAGSDFPLVDIQNPQGQTTTTFGYEPFTYNNKLNSNITQFSDIVTLYAGKHEITGGTQIYKKEFLNGFSPNYEGAYTFKSYADFYASLNGAATAKSYSLRYALTEDGSFPYAKVSATEIGFFAQDKIRVRSNLNVTVGVRIDVPMFKNQFQANPVANSLFFRDGMQYDVGQKPGSNPLVSPRLGFNWDVFNNQKTQIRGGIGSFSGPPPFVYVSNQASNNGVQFGSLINTVNPATGLPYVFSANINTYRPAKGAPPTSYNLVFVDKKFKYPQVLKTSIGIDQRLPGGVILSFEYTHNKDINAVNFENVNLPTAGVLLAGMDPRTRLTTNRINNGVNGTGSSDNPVITDAILMKNYNKGYSTLATLQAQKSFRNFYTSVAYTYSNSKSINDGGSIAQSTWRDRPVTNDPNAAELGFSSFNQPHRVIAQASYRIEYKKHFATSIGLIYEAAPAGVGSYVYNGDVNNDGAGGNNDLIYIPRDQTEIVVVPINTGGGSITDRRTPAQIWGQLDNFINQDPYMSQRRGQYAQRNGVVLPFFKKMDVNITQDFYVKSGKEKHTLRLSFDIINIGNLLNKNWGVAKSFSSTAFLKYEGLVTDPADVNVGKPRYSFLYQNATNQVPFVNSFQDNTSLFSRWQGQLGIRYLFN